MTKSLSRGREEKAQPKAQSWEQTGKVGNMKQGGDEEESLISDLENGEWQEVDGSESRQKNEMMTWAALPPAQTSCLASKPITLRESSLLLGVTGQTTHRHARTRTHTYKHKD